MPLVPGVVFTTSIGDFYNGDYLSGSTGIGFLSAIMAENSSYYLYPVVNAQVMTVANFPGMAEYCAKALPREHFKGMLMAPWIKTIEPYRRLHWQASDLIAEAIRRARI